MTDSAAMDVMSRRAFLAVAAALPFTVSAALRLRAAASLRRAVADCGPAG